MTVQIESQTPAGTTAYASRLCTKALKIAATIANRLSQKSSLSVRSAARLEVIQTCARLTRRGTTAISRPKVMSQAAPLPHNNSAVRA
jgi:hypothetical protein